MLPTNPFFTPDRSKEGSPRGPPRSLRSGHAVGLPQRQSPPGPEAWPKPLKKGFQEGSQAVAPSPGACRPGMCFSLAREGKKHQCFTGVHPRKQQRASGAHVAQQRPAAGSALSLLTSTFSSTPSNSRGDPTQE